MTCKDCIHSGLCYKENDYENFPDRCGDFIPNRPQGEWKVNKYGEHFCPKCGHYALYDEDQDNDYYEVQSNFCPNCGADMREEKRDEQTTD